MIVFHPEDNKTPPGAYRTATAKTEEFLARHPMRHCISRSSTPLTLRNFIHWSDATQPTQIPFSPPAGYSIFRKLQMNADSLVMTQGVSWSSGRMEKHSSLNSAVEVTCLRASGDAFSVSQSIST